MGLSLSGNGSRFSPLITLGVLGIFLGLMAVMVKDHYFSTPVALSDSVKIAAVESEDWFMIRIKGAYAGFGRSRQIRQGDNWLLNDELSISLNVQGRIKPILISSESLVDEAFKLVSFSVKVSSGIITFEQQGRMEGRDLVLFGADSKTGPARRLRLFETPRISRSLGLPMPLTGLSVGDEFQVPIFDPIDRQKWDARIKVLETSRLNVAGREVEAWLVQAELRSVQLKMWIDRDGRLLKGQLPLGITVVRSDRDEISRQMQTARNLPEMMSMASVPVEGTIPDPATIDMIRLRVQSGVRMGIVPNEARQQVRENAGEIELVITRETVPEPAYSIPFQHKNMEEFLESSRFIRSDHPDIIARARTVVGDEKDPVKAARLINAWVAGYLEKAPTPAVPDALVVLNTKQGDCNEHAVLAVSLARAVGIPARIALGLVHMNDGFYYHAWVEYWAGNRWVSGDPLINQFPADPLHVTLLYGDVDKHVNVLTFLGRLKLEVIEARKVSSREKEPQGSL